MCMFAYTFYKVLFLFYGEIHQTCGILQQNKFNFVYNVFHSPEIVDPFIWFNWNRSYTLSGTAIRF